MKRRFDSLAVVLLPVLMVSVGCEQQQQSLPASLAAVQAFQVARVRLQSSFCKIVAPKGDLPARIETFLSLEDQFGDPIKAVGQFRFEIYQYRPAFSDPRGQRFAIDGIQTIDLTTLEANQKHWDKITRSYRFDLKLPDIQKKTNSLVLQVTFTSGEDYRLQDMIVLNP